ncbi:Peptidoglycan-associated protein [Candidatus Desulfarcum epimagneticum]|uniref:Peptidoglycan-associated lipoprotein n=1 Tax=uncultured Desulfobacteraceae bacterium TaxID=218296 RepID=A0A484HLZ8_9BACT|nr:Peptidoglycan-associated protein [uncultured Desulfobacteraceae bacterium]
MRKKFLIGLSLTFIIPGLVMALASCAGKMGDRSSGMSQPAMSQSEEGTMAAEEQPAVAEETAAETDTAVSEREAEADFREATTPTPLTREQIAAMAIRERNMFINEDVYFDLDSSSLNAVARTVLQEKAEWLLKNSRTKVIIEGHCDDRGSNEYNLALGDRRAESVKAFLVDLNVGPERMSTISYGEESPVDSGKNEEAWAKNRRAHFTID